MKLFSFGCSLVFGDELQDTKLGTFSQLTWPALWAKEQGFSYQCFAENGLSNWAITRKLIQTLGEYKPDIILVQWTYNSRIEIRKNNNLFQNLSLWSNLENVSAMVKNSRPSRLRAWPKNKTMEEFEKEELKLEKELIAKSYEFDSEFAKLWYNNVSSYETDLYYSLIYINLALFWINMNGITAIFAASDNDLNNKIKCEDTVLNELYHHVQKNISWIGWPNKGGNGFIPWAQETEQIFGVSHPLEDAHVNALEIVRPQLNRIINEI